MQAAVDADIELFTSPTLLAELTEVLSRSHLASRLSQQRSSVEQAISLYSELAINMSPLATPQAVQSDPDDDHVVALGLAGRADFIVTGDKALLALGTYGGIKIVTVTAAVERISGVV